MTQMKYPPRKLDNDYRKKIACADVMGAPSDYFCKIVPPSRTLEQNAMQWPYLASFANNLTWPVNGSMCVLTDEEWKEVLTASFKKESVRVAAGVDGGMVMLGHSTSNFSKEEFSEWIEYLKWFAALKGIEPEFTGKGGLHDRMDKETHTPPKE